MDNHYSQIPEKPLIAGMSNKVEPIEQVFFFERNDGQVIAVKEQEAWRLYSKRPQILGKKVNRVEYKLVGTGEGKIFSQAVAEARVAGQTDIKKAQEIIRKGQQDELDTCRGKIIPPRNMDQLG